MTTAWNPENEAPFAVLLDHWNHHQELRRANTDVASLWASHRALAEARSALHLRVVA